MTKKQIAENLKLLKEEFSKEEMDANPEFMLYLAQTPSIDADRWNKANQEQRNKMVKPFIVDFIKENPNFNFDDLLPQMTEYNYHTERKVLEEELVKQGLREQKKPNKTLTDMLKYMPTFVVSDGNIEQVTPENFDSIRAKHSDKPKGRLLKLKKLKITR